MRKLYCMDSGLIICSDCVIDWADVNEYNGYEYWCENCGFSPEDDEECEECD